MKSIKLRYYLRALGIGIAVTALILGIAGGGKDAEMTDAQVRERALELGMVDAGSVMLSDLRETETISTEPSEESQEEPSEEVSQEAESVVDTQPEELPQEENTEETVEESVEDSIEESVEESVEESIEEIPEEVPQEIEEPVEESTETFTESEYVTLTIKSGASSFGVSKTLVELGVIESAGDFDDYLCNNGYSKSIRVGTFEIPTDADKEEIAKIITGKR